MLEGDLTDFTLPDVLRLLAFTSKTGRLTLDDGVRRGRVELRAGRVRDASADARRLPLARRVLGAGLVAGPDLLEVLADRDGLPTDLELARALADAERAEVGTLGELLREQTIDAAFDLLRWGSGSFRFVAATDTDAAPAPLELAMPVDELLEEASRRLDQWTHLVRRTGDLDAVVTIARPERGPGDQPEVSLPADGWSLLALVDGRRTVAELVAVSGQGEYRTRRTLGALLDEGVVTVGEAEAAGPLERLLRDQAALADRELALGGAVPVATDAPARLPVPAPTAAAAETAPPTVTLPDAATPPAAPAAPEGSDAPAVAAVPDPDPEPAVEAAVTRRPSTGPEAGDVRKLRTKVRSDRLRTDPTVDEDLVTRLIEGVEGL